MKPVDDVVQLTDVVKDFALDWRGRRWRALAGVSLTVRRGEICGLIGANGSGKSTLLKLLAGLLRPSAGSCVNHLATSLGYAPEQPGFPDHLTASEYLARLAGLGGKSRPVAQAAALRALGKLDLEGASGRRIREFSKGMRQRLGVAQALLDEPELILLDEPGAGLDPRALARLGEALQGERARGATVVFSSHFLPEIDRLCDRAILLEQGAAIFSGTAAEMREAGGATKLFLEKRGA